MSHSDDILGSADAYDADQVFDDVAPATPAAPSKDAQVRALREVIKQAQRSRLAPPAFILEIFTGPVRDVGEVESADPMAEILGLVEDDSDMFAPVDAVEYPITQNLYRKYRAAMPVEKIVRVDDDASYQRFMDGLRAPYKAELEQRLAALEAIVADHSADNHAHGRVANLEKALYEHQTDPMAHQIEVLGEAVEEARERAAVCGERVPLSLHPSTEGKVSSWQSGDKIYCSIRALDASGRPRVLTTATPAARHVEEVVSYAADAKVDPIEVMDSLPLLGQVLGGGALVTQLTKMAPDLLSRPEVARGDNVAVKAKPEGDPCLAAVMSLLQLCKRGSAQGCAELERLKAMARGAELVKRAEAALNKATKGRG